MRVCCLSLRVHFVVLLARAAQLRAVSDIVTRASREKDRMRVRIESLAEQPRVRQGQ